MAEKALYEEVIDFLDAVSAANDNGRKIIRPEITALRLQTPQTLLLDWPLNVQYWPNGTGCKWELLLFISKMSSS